MYMLVILIFVTTAYQQNIARARDFCLSPPENPNTEPVTGKDKYELNSTIRIQCIAGYVRKAGTSNQIRCRKENGSVDWKTNLPLVCIPDPKKKKAPTTRSDQHFTSSSTEIYIPTISGTSTPITATGYITLTTTANEVFTTKARTTNQPTLKSTTKEVESITSTNAITASSTASSIASRQYKSTTSPKIQSSSFTTTTGISVSLKTAANTTAKSEGPGSSIGNEESFSATIGGVTSILILCLAAAVFILWWRSRRRDYTNVIVLQLTNQDAADSDMPVSVTSVSGKNQADSVQDSDSFHI